MKEQVSTSLPFIISNELTHLRKIQETGINISICERQVVPEINSWIDQFIDCDFQKITLNTTPESFKKDFEQALSVYQSLHPVGFQLLLDDIDMLLKEFASISQTTDFKVYWAIVNDGMCRRFHTDANKLRLLCTYKGPGTEWVKPDNINFDLPHCSGNEMIINDQEIQQTKPYDVVILKGALHEHREAPLILHRSPPLENQETKRLLLRIDMSESW